MTNPAPAKDSSLGICTKCNTPFGEFDTVGVYNFKCSVCGNIQHEPKHLTSGFNLGIVESAKDSSEWYLDEFEKMNIYEELNGRPEEGHLMANVDTKLKSLLHKVSQESKRQGERELAEKLLDLPRKFWQDEDHAVGGYISKENLYLVLCELTALITDKKL